MITLTNGNFQGPSGLAVPNGSIELQLNVDATVVAAPYGIVLANVPIIFQFDANGDIQSGAKIWSNAELGPQNSAGLGTYYSVTFYSQAGARLNAVPMWWQFVEGNGETVDISQMTAFSTIGGNVIYYPTSVTLGTPGPATLGGVFSNAGSLRAWVASINTDGSVTLTQPSFSDLSGSISAGQLPGSFGATTFSDLITAQNGIQIGLSGTNPGLITLEGGTSGACTIVAPSAAGTITSPIAFSNSIQIPSGTVFSIGGDTGLSRDSAGVIDVGNGAAGNKSGTLNAANVSASVVAATGDITATNTLTTPTQPLFRLIDSELTLSSAVTSASSSVTAIRGNTTLAAGGTISSGFIYGVQGKLSLGGTLSTPNFTAGVFAQLDLSATQGLSASNVSALWADMGATFSAPAIAGEALLDIAHLTSTAPGSMINSALHVEALSTYLLDVSNAAYPAGWTGTTTVGLQIGRIKIKTPTGAAYIPVYAAS